MAGGRQSNARARKGEGAPEVRQVFIMVTGIVSGNLTAQVIQRIDPALIPLLLGPLLLGVLIGWIVGWQNGSRWALSEMRKMLK